MGGLPDPDWYLDHVLVHAQPGGPGARVDGPAARWQRWWSREVELDAVVLSARASGFVLRTGELDAVGVSRSRRRHAVRTGRWTAAGFGAVGTVDVRADDPFLVARRRHALACVAAARGRADHVVSGRSAAVLHGLPVTRVPNAPELTASVTRRRGARNGATTFAAFLDGVAITRWFGVPVTTIARTLCDLARHDRHDGIMAADAALAERLVTAREIEAALAQARGWPGVRSARDVLRLADPRAESPLESVVRLALHDDGFPPPQLQVWFGRDRVDLYLAEYGLVIEADGRGKYTGDELWREKAREQRLRHHVRGIERVTWSDVFSSWPATSARLRAASRLRSSLRWS